MEIKRIFLAVFSVLFLSLSFVFGENSVETATESTEGQVTDELINVYGPSGEIFTITESEYNAVVLQNREYFVKTDEEGKQVMFQRFEWEPAEFSKGYIFKLEKQIDDGSYIHLRDFELTDKFILMALEAGSYRYSIEVLDFFGKVCYETGVYEFTLIKALMPVIKSISPETIYLEEPYDGVYKISGENFIEDSEIFLKGIGKKINPADIQITDKNGKSAVVSFNPDSLDTGSFDFFIRNPGGFYTSKKINIKYFKWYNWDLAIDYAPLFVLSDDTLKHYVNSDKSFIGSRFKLTFIPIKRLREYFGFSLSGFYHYFYGIQPGYTTTGHIIQSYLNFVYQYPIIRNRIILDVHGGAGAMGLLNLEIRYPNEFKSETFNSFYFSADAGIAFNVFIKNKLSLEFGSDFIYSIVGRGCIIGALPYLGLGWQF